MSSSGPPRRVRVAGRCARAWLVAVLMLPIQALGGDFALLARVSDADLPEPSGLAASRRWPGVYWTHNDSGGLPMLYALNRRGQVLARIAVAGAGATDWEDIALFEREGQSWLAIGDIGDNLAWRQSVSVYLLPEPALDASEVSVARRIDLQYPDGPRDAEALAVDAAAGELLLLEKGGAPAGFYALPLDPPPGLASTRRVAEVTLPWPQPLPPVAPLDAARGRVAVTAMDLSRDGRQLAVMTYSHLYRYRRAPGEDWATAFARAPQVWPLPRHRGFEAMAVEADGVSVVVIPEGQPAPLYRAKGLLRP